jgi:hypothetical protein
VSGSAEVNEDDASVPRQDDVRRLDVLMDHAMGVEVIENHRDSGQPVEDGVEWEPRGSFFPKDSLEVSSLDPIHDQVVAIPSEEVVADHRHAGMRRQVQEDSGLVQAGLPVRPDLADLQRHLATVLMIERELHLALSAPTEHHEGFVTSTDQT